jgi:REP element-mobilizing transposase RayT
MFRGVRLHAYHFMSNHAHMLVSAGDGADLAAFIGYVFGNVARELGRLHYWRGPFWARRASVVPILDADTMVARLRYILSQGVKEGLVEKPQHWPGASSTSGLLGEPIVGVWVDRGLETRLRKRNAGVDESLFTTRYALRLTPLPCWDELAPDEQRSRVLHLIDEIVQEARAVRGRPPLGIRQLLRQDPHSRPSEPAHSPTPLCHASSPRLREAFRAAYRAFCDAFRSVANAVRSAASARRTDFPPGCFPRPQWFVDGTVPFFTIAPAS